MKILAVNFGNSMISAALMEGAILFDRFSIGIHGGESVAALGSRLHGLGAEASPLAAASVNPSLFEEAERTLSFPIRLAGRDFPVPIPNRSRRPEETGIDRLLAGYAAAVLYGPPAVVVDFGTALTFNLIGPDGAFLGGAIVPGLSLAARALHEGCAQLPQAKLSQPPPSLGRDTDESIASGLLNGYVGLVDRIVEGLVEEAGEECRRVATGGEAFLILPRSSGLEIHDPDLALKGISLAYEASASS